MSAAPCPVEAPEIITCPRGCGLVALASPSLSWGPWRMQVHLSLSRCPTPFPGSNSRRLTPAELRRYRSTDLRGHHRGN